MIQLDDLNDSIRQDLTSWTTRFDSIRFVLKTNWNNWFKYGVDRRILNLELGLGYQTHWSQNIILKQFAKLRNGIIKHRTWIYFSHYFLAYENYFVHNLHNIYFIYTISISYTQYLFRIQSTQYLHNIYFVYNSSISYTIYTILVHNLHNIYFVYNSSIS